MTRTVFMGTPGFAVPSLEAVHRVVNLVGVFTQPDRPTGRGRKTEPSAVKQKAIELGLDVFQPRTLRAESTLQELRALAPELIVVTAYGLILPQSVLDIPRFHCINVHASLLPRHRGASPIASAILHGDTETGVTLMQMEAGLDTGPIIAQRALPIRADDTTETLEQSLSALGAKLLEDCLPRWLAGEMHPVPQDETRVTLTRLIRKEEGTIDWSESAEVIARKVRAYYPWPGAVTLWRGQPLKIVRAQPVERTAAAGLVTVTEGEVFVGTAEGSLALELVQLAGKRQTSAADFARGYREFAGSYLGCGT